MSLSRPNRMLAILWGLDLFVVVGLVVVAFISAAGQDAAGRGMIWGLAAATALPLACSILVRQLSTSGIARGVAWGTAVLPIVGMLLVGVPRISQQRERSRTEGGSRFFTDVTARQMASAMSKTDTLTMRQIAATGLDLNTVGAEGTTLLTFGILHAPAAVPLLLDLGADPGFAPPAADLPVAQAVYAGSRALVPLLKKGARPVNRAGEQLAFHAIKRDQENTLSLLLAYGADLKATDSKGYSLLMRAVEHRLWMPALTMLDRGADPMYATPRGETLLALIDAQLARLDVKKREHPEYVELRRRLKAMGLELAPPVRPSAIG